MAGKPSEAVTRRRELVRAYMQESHETRPVHISAALRARGEQVDDKAVINDVAWLKKHPMGLGQQPRELGKHPESASLALAATHQRIPPGAEHAPDTPPDGQLSLRGPDHVCVPSMPPRAGQTRFRCILRDCCPRGGHGWHDGDQNGSPVG